MTVTQKDLGLQFIINLGINLNDISVIASARFLALL